MTSRYETSPEGGSKMQGWVKDFFLGLGRIGEGDGGDRSSGSNKFDKRNK